MQLKSIFFHGLILTVIAGAAALGIWQLERREWKHQLMSEMQMRLNQPAALWNGTTSKEWEWRRADIPGWFQFDSMLVMPKYQMNCLTQQNEWGYDVIYLIKPDGMIDSAPDILVRMGWFSQSAYQQELINQQAKRQDRVYTFSGVLRPFEAAPLFTPAHQNNNQWAYMSPDMYTAVGVPIQPFFLEISGPEPAGISCAMPTANRMPDPKNLPDNHLAYALTWFGLATVLTALYIYRLWTTRAQSQ